MLAVALPIVVGVSLMALGTLVLRKAQGARHNVRFAGLFFFSGIKSVSEGLDDVAGGLNYASRWFPPTLFWQLLAFFCALAMHPVLFLFVCRFPRPVAWLARAPWLAFPAFFPSLLSGWLVYLVFQDAR